jgi:hypothetical protein
MKKVREFFQDLLTSKDGVSYDVVRAAITGVTLMLPVILVWGLSLYTYGYFFNKPFDIKLFFEATGAFLVSFGVFLMSGAGSLLFKKGTEPGEDGSMFTQKTETVSTTTTTAPSPPGGG